MSRVAFWERDVASTKRIVPPDVSFVVERYSWKALGGPHLASLTAAGSENHRAHHSGRHQGCCWISGNSLCSSNATRSPISG